MPDRSKQPATHPFGAIELHYPTPVQLSNGIPVYCVGSEDAGELMQVTVYVKGGTFQEEKPLLAALTTTIILEGNTSMTAQEVNETLDYYGAVKSPGTHDYWTKLKLKSLSSNLRETLPVFGNCVMHPLFPEQEFELAKQNAASLLSNERLKVSELAQEEAQLLYYGPQHPLGKAKSVQPEDILHTRRQDLVDFHHNYFRPANARIVIAGKVGKRELETLEGTFGQWHDERPASELVHPVAASLQKKLSIVDKPDALQSAVVMLLPAIKRTHPDYFKLRLTVMALGGYFGSRLETDLREQQGLTYGISAMLLGRLDEAHIAVETECDTAYVGKVIAGVKRHMERMKHEPLPDAELNMVKMNMLSDLAKTLDTPFSKASYVSNAWVNGVYPTYFNEQTRAIAKMTAEDVMLTAQKYFDTSLMQVAMAGDKSKLEEVIGPGGM